MIIERFRPGMREEIYRRFAERGRMLPDGVRYIDSWISRDLVVCYQLMESERRELLDQWMSHWNDLVEFEVVEVISSAEAAAASS